jgi:NADP-dependent 3-hydroxy acid dehydrogenase YdfG
MMECLTAEAFAKAGCKLILASRGEEALSQAVDRCKEIGAETNEN